jgi:hypothetical protein
MRASILAATTLVALAAAAPGLARPTHHPHRHAATKSTSGQCRDQKGSFVACGQGSAATDSEGVPLAAKASVIRKSAAEQTSAIIGVAPGEATAHCRDGTYSTSKRRAAACGRQGGVASWIK